MHCGSAAPVTCRLVCLLLPSAVFGNELVAASTRSHEQISQLEDVLLKQLR